MRDWQHMGRALALAEEAAARGEVPVGAVVVDCDGAIVGEGANACEAGPDATAHAEVVAIRQAAAHRGGWRLGDCSLLVTLEPCLMCVGAIRSARIPRLVFAASDPRAGFALSRAELLGDARLEPRAQVVGGLRAAEAQALLARFFASLRSQNERTKKGQASRSDGQVVESA